MKIIIGPNGEQVMKFVEFENSGVKIESIDQGVSKGLAHTILADEGFLDDEFVMYLENNILREGVIEYVKKLQESNCEASILLTEVENSPQFRIGELNEDGTIKKLGKHGLRMRKWKAVLKDYVVERGCIITMGNEK